MSAKKEVKLFEPYEVGDVIVFLTSKTSAKVVDIDCRWELEATTTGCECCTYQWRSRSNKHFKCRHMEALLHVLNNGE
ncbi:zinc finger SWIM domain protein [Desulfonispora thiosulfatigenes DSM 11270]|uniref:Zinc finger SWIM domain protein n=1 Tax=Desulfonispora thiosulfatigenes DSM 11270 TaxID=656914 RepID=A0A1W1UR28_DESTI|nr:hypothetical protein [Desulfonispora thiosulfatigenes]SMB83469.1 zinc finger SWIM domain protein [Desulfonispora thiosulfatigenes DSM 11270]